MLLVQTNLERELALIVATNMPGRPDPGAGGDAPEGDDDGEGDDEEAEPT